MEYVATSASNGRKESSSEESSSDEDSSSEESSSEEDSSSEESSSEEDSSSEESSSDEDSSSEESSSEEDSSSEESSSEEDSSSEESSSDEDSSSIESKIQSLRHGIKRTGEKVKKIEQHLQERPVVRTARHIRSLRLEGNNIGVFGLTSTGKSTLVNSLLGRKAAETGAGETTTKITPYSGRGYTLWDAPGRNDVVSYEKEKYISLIKGLTYRLILIQSSVRENRDLMRLFNDLNLDYYIVVSKYDLVDEDEQEDFKRQIQRETRSLNLKQMQRVFFISAKYPNRFPDWLKMVDHLTK